MFRYGGRLACAAALVLLAAGPASAGVLKVPPTAFRPAVTGTSYFQSVDALGTLGALTRFTAPIRLPAGARVTGADFFYKALGPGQVEVELALLDPADSPSSLVTVGSGANGAASPGLQALLLSADSSVTLVRGRYGYVVNVDMLFGGVLQEVRVRYDAP